MKRQHIGLVALWLLLVVISLFSRSYVPIDETRYVTVAWNMWLRGDFLVPYLNNIPYSHKPPLLFWLMDAGWAVLGVNDWWPRLVPSLFALGSLFLTSAIADRLWPRQRQIAQLAPVILIGCALWTVFTTATMFDLIVAFFTALGMLGILIACQDKSRKGWLLLGLAIGGGLLAKGPTILLQLLPLALLAPWWGRGMTFKLRSWYGGILLAVLVGAAIALLWAIPAAIHGGPVYSHAIFWGQTADRMVNSFAHRRAFWWYLPFLPIMLFPWLFWLGTWRGLKATLSNPDFGIRFCLATLVPVFIAFSLVSGKQMHYLLPLFPAFALLLARGLQSVSPSRSDKLPAAIITLALGALIIYLPFYAQLHHLAPWVSNISVWNGVALIACALLLLTPSAQAAGEVWKMSLFSAAVVVIVVYSIVMHGSGLAYDLRPIALQLKTLEDRGIPIAHVGKYAGQYQFLGRLHKEPEEVAVGDIGKWFVAHPTGKVIAYFNSDISIDGLQYDYMQLYKGDRVVILGKQAWPPMGNHQPISPNNG
jgi:4-amino-4-deoxy-L-arabinose transferase-like glycosyltransferase